MKHQAKCLTLQSLKGFDDVRIEIGQSTQPKVNSNLKLIAKEKYFCVIFYMLSISMKNILYCEISFFSCELVLKREVTQ